MTVLSLFDARAASHFAQRREGRMAAGDERVANLWLADELWKLGAVQFGDFSLGNTVVHSPVYVNLRLLISSPAAMRRAAEVMQGEVQALQSMRNPRLAPYDLVAGIPFGGLHLATVFSLISGTPLIYLHPAKNGEGSVIEGTYEPGQTALIIDDLITGGRSVQHTAIRLEDEGLLVEDALVLLDRQQGGREQLQRAGINLVAILTLEAVLHYLGSSQKISKEWYHKSMEYLERQRSKR
jgi:orotate phosphoribosyltransferase/uridine monophosphate synthetase